MLDGELRNNVTQSLLELIEWTAEGPGYDVPSGYGTGTAELEMILLPGHSVSNGEDTEGAGGIPMTVQ